MLAGASSAEDTNSRHILGRTRFTSSVAPHVPLPLNQLCSPGGPSVQSSRWGLSGSCARLRIFRHLCVVTPRFEHERKSTSVYLCPQV